MSTHMIRATALAVLLGGLVSASTCTPPVAGIDGRERRLDATATFQNVRGALAILNPEWIGGTDRLHELTSRTIQNDLQQLDLAVAMKESEAPEHPKQPLSAYLFDLRDDAPMPLSAQQHGAVSRNAGASEMLADFGAEPFDPMQIAAAALPKGREPDVDASQPRAILGDTDGGGLSDVRLAAFVVTPDLEKRNAVYFAVGGAFLALAVRFRRVKRRPS